MKRTARGYHAVEDEVRILDVYHVIAKMRIAVPDFFPDPLVVNDLRKSGDADLVIMTVKVAKLDPRVGLDLGRLAVRSEVRNVDREPIGLHRRDWPQTGLVTFHSSQVRQSV